MSTLLSLPSRGPHKSTRLKITIKKKALETQKDNKMARNLRERIKDLEKEKIQRILTRSLLKPMRRKQKAAEVEGRPTMLRS